MLNRICGANCDVVSFFFFFDASDRVERVPLDDCDVERCALRYDFPVRPIVIAIGGKSWRNSLQDWFCWTADVTHGPLYGVRCHWDN